MVSGTVFATLFFIIGNNIAGIISNSKGLLPKLWSVTLFTESTNGSYNVYRVKNKAEIEPGERLVFKGGRGYSTSIFQRQIQKHGEYFMVLSAEKGDV